MSEGATFINAQEVAAVMGIAVPTAYRVIRGLNKELEAAGRITFAGRVLRSYFLYKVGASPVNPLKAE